MSIRAVLVCSVATAVLGAGAPVFAQMAPDADEPASGSVYARLGGGVLFANDLQQDLSYDPSLVLPAIVDPVSTERTTDFGSSATGVFAVGFTYPSSGTRTELEYRYASLNIDSVIETGSFAGPVALAASESVDLHYLMSNIYFDFDTGTWLTPFVGFGVGGAFTQNGLGERDAAFAYQGRAGFAAALGETLSFDVEYVYTRTRDIVYGPEDFDDSDEIIRADGDAFATSSVMASIRKTF